MPEEVARLSARAAIMRVLLGSGTEWTYQCVAPERETDNIKHYITW